MEAARTDTTKAEKKANAKKGVFRSIGRAFGRVERGVAGVGNMLLGPEARLRREILRLQVQGVISRVSKADSQCVICQFVIQRVRAEMLLNGIGGSIPFGLNADTLARLNAGKLAAAPAGSAAMPASGSSQSSAQPASQASSLLEEQERWGGPLSALSRGAHWIGDRLGITSGRRDPVYRQFPTVERWEPHQVPPPAQRTRSGWLTKRERDEDLLIYRPTQTRYADLGAGPLTAEALAQERYENNQIYSTVYQVVEEICTKRMPKPFFAYCGGIMRRFQEVANGLRWRDRPDAICMALNFCGITSYVQSGPHSTYKDYY